MDQCKPVLLGLSLAGNLVKPLLSLYGTEWRERGYGPWLPPQYMHYAALPFSKLIQAAALEGDLPSGLAPPDGGELLPGKPGHLHTH